MIIIDIVATRCQILRLKCIKIDFGWGSVPDPTGGAYSAPPDLPAAFKEPTSRGREGGKGRAWEEKGEKERECPRWEGKGWEVPPALLISPLM